MLEVELRTDLDDTRGESTGETVVDLSEGPSVVPCQADCRGIGIVMLRQVEEVGA